MYIFECNLPVQTSLIMMSPRDCSPHIALSNNYAIRQAITSYHKESMLSYDKDNYDELMN